MQNARIPFNRPFVTGREIDYIQQIETLSGDGAYTKRCHKWLEDRTGAAKALLTHSCTAALEMSAILCDIQAGDEVIMPSYTFASTANAFVLRGGVPVFVDVREDTLNLDERLIESAITPRTKAVVPVHYAGVACAMDVITDLARSYGLRVVEDAAQGVMSTYKGKVLGAIGDLGAYSFHETKNLVSGEGGALLVNDPDLADRAEIIREKGTDRSRFFRGEVDKYTWQEAGSSFLPSELIAAFLWAQLESAEGITAQRLEAWDRYHEMLKPMEMAGLIRRPIVPAECQHNAHMYYVLLDQKINRQQLLELLKGRGIGVISHYVPLHTSPAGLRYGRVHGSMELTTRQSARLVRLPLWSGITQEQQSRVVTEFTDIIRGLLG